MKLEGGLSRKHGSRLEISQFLVEELVPGPERASELLLFPRDHLDDAVLLLHQFGIRLTHHIDG